MKLRTFFFSSLVLALALSGCGGDDDGMTPTGDAGTDAGTDAGSPDPDSGTPDAGTDAGPVGCQENCELVELALGVDFSCVRRASGEVRCWGGNAHGELGDGSMRHGTDCRNTSDTEVLDCTGPVTTNVENAVQITARGAFAACARNDADEVWCWGWAGVSAAAGAEREERFDPVMMPLPGGASDVSEGWLANCAVVGGEVYCLGDNDSGQAGVADLMEVRTPTKLESLSGIVDVEVGVFGTFACARSADAVWCWGSNEHGQLGDGMTGHAECMRGGSAGTYDCSPTPVSVTTLDDLTENVVQLTLGSRHACALTDAGTVYCWGENALGQLGLGDTTGRSVPTEVTALAGSVTQIAAGGSHTCALLDTGAIQCWGAHDEGQLGDGQDINTHETCPFGSENLDCSTSPVDVAVIDDATSIAAGADHTCAIRPLGDNGEAWCWGYNNHLQLATGDTERERRTMPVMAQGIDQY